MQSNKKITLAIELFIFFCCLMGNKDLYILKPNLYLGTHRQSV